MQRLAASSAGRSAVPSSWRWRTRWPKPRPACGRFWRRTWCFSPIWRARPASTQTSSTGCGRGRCTMVWSPLLEICQTGWSDSTLSADPPRSVASDWPSTARPAWSCPFCSLTHRASSPRSRVWPEPECARSRPGGVAGRDARAALLASAGLQSGGLRPGHWRAAGRAADRRGRDWLVRRKPAPSRYRGPHDLWQLHDRPAGVVGRRRTWSRRIWPVAHDPHVAPPVATGGGRGGGNCAYIGASAGQYRPRRLAGAAGPAGGRRTGRNRRWSPGIGRGRHHRTVRADPGRRRSAGADPQRGVGLAGHPGRYLRHWSLDRLTRGGGDTTRLVDVWRVGGWIRAGLLAPSVHLSRLARTHQRGRPEHALAKVLLGLWCFEGRHLTGGYPIPQQRLREHHGGADAVDHRHAKRRLHTLVHGAHASAPQQDSFGVVVGEGEPRFGGQLALGNPWIFLDLQHRQFGAPHRRQARLQTVVLDQIFEQRFDARQHRHDREAVGHHTRHQHRRFGNANDRYVEQLAGGEQGRVAVTGNHDSVVLAAGLL